MRSLFSREASEILAFKCICAVNVSVLCAARCVVHRDDVHSTVLFVCSVVCLLFFISPSSSVCCFQMKFSAIQIIYYY